MVPSFLAAIVLVSGLFASGSRTLQLQIVFCLFGGAAALLLTALGGAVVTPAVLFLPFLLYRAASESRLNFSRVTPAGFWLGAAVLWGVVGAILLPRLLGGTLQVLTVDRSAGDEDVSLLWLRPVSGNITQSAYAVGNVFTFFAFRALLARKGRHEDFCSAMLLLGALNGVAAVLNLGEHHLGLPPVLEYVRTGYTTFGTYEAEGTGLVRIHGTFPETSMFSAFTLPIFAFSFSLWLSGVRPAYSGAVAAASLLFLSISTSGTAYVGLAAYLGCVLFVLWRRNAGSQKLKHLSKLFMIGLVGLALVAGAVVFEYEGIKRVGDVLDATVLQKLESDSGSTRSMWNQQAWANFVESYGIGIGLGSARASSFPLVLLSNLGALGTLCYAAFLYRVLRGERADPALQPVQRAARQAVLAGLISAAVSGTVFDLGVAFYACAAVATVQTAEGRSRVAEVARRPAYI